VTVVVHMPTLTRLDVMGSGNIRCGAFDRAEDVTVKLTGSGDVDLQGVKDTNELSLLVEGSGDIVCGTTAVSGSTHIRLMGSGDVSVQGSTRHIEVDILGSGDVKASGMTAQTGRVHITGSGDAHVHSVGEVEGRTTGSGTIHATGKAGN
jgi:hypothetical protein